MTLKYPDKLMVKLKDQGYAFRNVDNHSFDELERRWANIGQQKKYTKAERADLDLEKEQLACFEQESMWAEYQSYVQEYEALGLEVKPCQMPITKDALKSHRDKNDFVRQWADEINRHKRQLLPWHRDQVDFPKAPFTSIEIEAYVRSIRPYLKRKQRLYFGVISVIAVVIGLMVYLWS